MIAEILDRRVMLAVLRQLRGDLGEDGLVSRADLPEHADALIDLMGDSLQREEAAEADAVGEAMEQPDIRQFAERGEPIIEEHVAYLPRDPMVSATQSMLEEYFADVEPERVIEDPPPGQQLGDDRGDWPPPITAKHIRLPQPLDLLDLGLFDRYSLTDPHWARSKLSEWFTHWNGRHYFVDEERPPITHLADGARMVMVGDWASGLPRAEHVATLMNDAINVPLARGMQVHVVHLGDTYYSGWRREYKDHLLQHWPVPPHFPHAFSWTLNGNHDMYSGGDGYYELLQMDPRFHGHNGLSYFHLQNEHWDVLGLDTAYEDHDLAGSQAGWVEGVVNESPRKRLLLSHHQPFSARNSGGQRLMQRLAGVLQPDRPIDAWFWGHEHRHAHYQDVPGIRNGRLLGHGGVPMWMWRRDSDSYPAPEEWEYRERLPGRHLMPLAVFGFAILDFKQDHIEVSYVNELGTTYRTETIT